MFKTTLIAATILAATTLTACGSSSEKYKDDSKITFKNGNVYMPKKLCDTDEVPDISPEKKKQLEDWYENHILDGDVVCTK